MADNRKPNPPSDRLQELAACFGKLTYREMMDLGEVLAEALQAANGLNVKPQVFADVLDSFGEYLVGLEVTD
jgi:hypothetical protein